MKLKLLNLMIKLEVLLLCIQTVLVLDLNLQASYLDLTIHGFPQFLQADAENTLKYAMTIFFHVPIQFTNHPFDDPHPIQLKHHH